MRTAIVLLCAAALLLAGCAGAPAGGSDPGSNTTETTTTSTTSTTTETADTSTTTETTSTTITTADDPEKGDNLLSLSAVPNSTAENASAHEKANFSALSAAQREVFLEAHDCDCNVEQSVFRFNDKDRIQYVRYEGQWYFLRVTIV